MTALGNMRTNTLGFAGRSEGSSRDRPAARGCTRGLQVDSLAWPDLARGLSEDHPCAPRLRLGRDLPAQKMHRRGAAECLVGRSWPFVRQLLGANVKVIHAAVPDPRSP
jgi:hypothetical protein